MPREGRVTGQVDIHDIAMGDLGHFGAEGGHAPVFVATKFNALATLSTRDNLKTLWQPPFITSKTFGDRCHLNGLAMDGDRTAYVTIVGQSDELAGWRDHRRNGGIVMDVVSNEVVANGLSMPHSPRLYRGKLWVLNSGMGELSVVDPADGKVTPVAFCSGFARGLSFIDNYAIVGVSRPRNNTHFEDVPLDERLQAMKQSARCGFLIIDINTGKMVEWLLFQHTITELYDVAVMLGVTQPELIGFDGARQMDAMIKIEGGESISNSVYEA